MVLGVATLSLADELKWRESTKRLKRECLIFSRFTYRSSLEVSTVGPLSLQNAFTDAKAEYKNLQP